MTQLNELSKEAWTTTFDRILAGLDPVLKATYLYGRTCNWQSRLIAEHFGISQRTARARLQRLRSIGLPVPCFVQNTRQYHFCSDSYSAVGHIQSHVVSNESFERDSSDANYGCEQRRKIEAQHHRSASADAPRQEEAIREIEALRHELHSVRRRLSIYEALEATPPYHIPEYRPSKGHAIPVAVLSDVHLGETVSPDDVPGNKNCYDTEIAKRRVEQFFQRTVFMNKEVAPAVAEIDTLILAFLGDLMTGHIHEELRESNSLTPIQEVVALEEILSAGIEHILSKCDYKKIIIPCCHGNHGRTTATMRSRLSAENSYEWLLYQHLAKRWAREKRLEWHIASSYHLYIKVWDTVIRFHHGDAISYRDGIGGLTVPLRKAINQWNTIVYAHLDVLGHWHQFIDGGDFIVNGSVIGMNAFAVRNKCRFEPPQQAWFLIDAHRGKSMTARLFTDYMP